MTTAISPMKQYDKKRYQYAKEMADLEDKVQKFKKLIKVYHKQMIASFDKKIHIPRTRLLFAYQGAQNCYRFFNDKVMRLDTFVKNTMPCVVYGEDRLDTSRPEERYALIEAKFNELKALMFETEQELQKGARIYEKN